MEERVWSLARAEDWGRNAGRLLGCDYIPRNAINQLEMWQAETFDAATIDQELGWAAGLGMNTLRVYLHDLAYEADPDGFLGRIDRFLAVAACHGIRPLFCIFDDCWNPDPKIGPQPAPKPSVHNSGWVQSPAADVKRRPESWGRLEVYVKAVVGRFAQDPRVLLWDVYNEPGNGDFGRGTEPLLRLAFAWAREAVPSQPLTAGVWRGLDDTDCLCVALSDVVSFHAYNHVDEVRGLVATLLENGRPTICTEWLARGQQDPIATLELFRGRGIGALNWGLVRGKTNTIWPWNTPEGAPEPPRWHHDLLHPDGTPYDEREAAAFRSFGARPFAA